MRFATLAFVSAWLAGAAAAAPVKVIFDTDLGEDYDDVGALSELHALADLGEAEILAVLSCNRIPETVQGVRLLNRYYGRPEIPVGTVSAEGISKGGGPQSWFAKWFALYPPCEAKAEDAVAVCRRALAAAPDKSVTIVTVGFLTNMRQLLQSAGDAASPLDGRALVEKKVRQMVSMAFRFPKGGEYNSQLDGRSSKYVADHWPTPIIFSGGELGVHIEIGRRLVTLPDAHNPVKDAFVIRHVPGASWDETAVYVAVRGPENLFGLVRGRIEVAAENGSCVWKPDPQGPHAYLVKKMEYDDVAQKIEDLMMRSPRSVGPAAFRRIAVADYRNKLKGGWIGQSAGVVWGAPTEFKWVDKLVPEDSVPAWKPELINGMFGQDDLYVEMTFLRSLEQYGLDVPIRQAGLDFANSSFDLWCANQAGRTNLRLGIAPPDSSHPAFNKCPNDIDYQIEADYAGLISPGMPQSVIAFGRKFGRLMNYGDGVYGGQFVGGMYAESYFTTNVETIIRAGLACIPPASQYAEMVRDALAWHAANPSDWQGYWQKAIAKYRRDPAYQRASNGKIDVKINGTVLLMGLLYGNRDFDRTITIAMRGGFDSDCNPSSAAGPLFASAGAAAVPARFTEKLDLTRKFSHTDYTFPELLMVCEKLTRQILIREGGRVETDASGKEWFVIPVKQPVPDCLELSWAPGPIAGSRFTPEECAKLKHRIRYSTDELADPDPTKAVQKAADKLFPGWVTSPNGAGAGYQVSIWWAQEYGLVTLNPPKPGASVTLTRDAEIPAGQPKLRLRFACDWERVSSFTVRADGKELCAKAVKGASGNQLDFQSAEVDLAAFAGKRVRLELVTPYLILKTLEITH